MRIDRDSWPVAGEMEIAGAPGPDCMRGYFFWFLAVSSILGALFFFYPVIDLWAAAQFYDRHQGFLIGNTSSNSTLPFLPWFAKIFITACWLLIAINLLRSHYFGKQRPVVASNRVVIFLLFTLGIGPGLVVNTILKDHCGRARPFQVTEFGGRGQFTPAFVISDQCETNCSFVSGDASLGYFGLAFFFVARRQKAIVASAAVLAGTLIGLVRMAQGAHFLSDVIFAGVFTFLTAWLLYLWILRPRPIRETLQYKQR